MAVALQSARMGQSIPRPVLKWAGGKTQILPELLSRAPGHYAKFIEPFFGGGALFFALAPKRSVVADSNPELINLYKVLAHSVEAVIERLKTAVNTEEAFYLMRAIDWQQMDPVDAAARTIYLNRTCFNGLYRVNRGGQFNVPYGRYKNPRILDEDGLRAASILLGRAQIIAGDYRTVLSQFAEPGDFVFLDPPYLPISQYSDFKRYTKEQFYEDDHRDLASEVERLHRLGCHVVLTNSNHPLVHELYGDRKLEIVQTRRHIASDASRRTGEDVIVTVPPKARVNIQLVPPPLSKQVSRYPSTRYMGSKSKILREIWGVASQFKFDTALDLFAGSGVVGYMLKSQGKAVFANDYMAMSHAFVKATIENTTETLSDAEAQALLKEDNGSDGFVERTFEGLYFSTDENRLIDKLRRNISKISNPYKRAIAMSALIRACLKKRPRGIFTYVGHRYDDGRLDLCKSFEEQFVEGARAINEAVFDNGYVHKARHGNAMDVPPLEGAGLVYMDPPYYSPFSDNEYVRRYHFVEGLARDWKGVDIQSNTVTKKFKSYPTPFSSRNGAHSAFDALFRRFRESVLLVSYSSNSLPTLDEMVSLLSKHKEHVDVVPIEYRYSFGTHGHKIKDNKNSVKEYLFVGY